MAREKAIPLRPQPSVLSIFQDRDESVAFSRSRSNSRSIEKMRGVESEIMDRLSVNSLSSQGRSQEYEDPSKKRKRFSNPSVHKVGTRATYRDAKDLARKDEYVQAEFELEADWTEPRKTRRIRSFLDEGLSYEEERIELRDMLVTNFVAEMEKSVGAIRKMATFKKGYFRTSIKVLKEVACIVSAAHTTSEECK